MLLVNGVDQPSEILQDDTVDKIELHGISLTIHKCPCDCVLTDIYGANNLLIKKDVDWYTAHFNARKYICTIFFLQ